MSKSSSIPVEQSASVPQAVEGFLEEMRAWSERVEAAHPDGWQSDSHDGGTFMTSWEVYVRATEDTRPLEFMRRYRDDARAHFEQTDQWLHGYWRKQEAHHGTEHFGLFLQSLWRLAPEDAETIRQVEDAAEHIGNWVKEIPAWYDWEEGLFRSFPLGTETVGDPAINIPDHVRFVDIALLAEEMTGAGRYLELADHYGGRWADALLDGPQLPVGLDGAGAAYDLGGDRPRYRAFAGAAPEDLTANLPRVENLITSGVPDVLLRLWRHTGEDRFRDAAARIVEVAAEVLDNPVAWQAQATVRRFRECTGSTDHDERVRAVPPESIRPVSRLTLVQDPEEPCVTCPLGMRADKPDWLDEEGRPAPSPLLMALRALVDDDRALLARALDLGLAHFRLGQQAYGDTAHHGCGSRSLSAVARGHGRLDGAGVVTEVLGPALDRLKA